MQCSGQPVASRSSADAKTHQQPTTCKVQRCMMFFCTTTHSPLMGAYKSGQTANQEERKLDFLLSLGPTANERNHVVAVSSFLVLAGLQMTLYQMDEWSKVVLQPAHSAAASTFVISGCHCVQLSIRNQVSKVQCASTLMMSGSDCAQRSTRSHVSKANCALI